MKYIVASGEPLRVAGVRYPPGSVIDIFGRELLEHYQGRLVTITDPELIRALEVNAHPFYVLAPFTWGRKPYAAGEIFWVVMRSQLQHLPADTVRPATGDEVLAWLPRRQDGASAAAPAAVKNGRGRKRKARAAAPAAA